jgi:hypothetical protein
VYKKNHEQVSWRAILETGNSKPGKEFTIPVVIKFLISSFQFLGGRQEKPLGRSQIKVLKNVFFIPIKENSNG